MSWYATTQISKFLIENNTTSIRNLLQTISCKFTINLNKSTAFSDRFMSKFYSYQSNSKNKCSKQTAAHVTSSRLGLLHRRHERTRSEHCSCHWQQRLSKALQLTAPSHTYCSLYWSLTFTHPSSLSPGPPQVCPRLRDPQAPRFNRTDEKIKFTQVCSDPKHSQWTAQVSFIQMLQTDCS